MRQRRNARAGRRLTGRSAFTLVELLVVIGIITVLIGITVPFVSSMRQRANAANTAAQINGLRAAIEAYRTTFGAYPGPLSDEQVCRVPGAPNLPSGIVLNAGSMAMSENLVLGLLGGLVLQGNAIAYQQIAVGQGPMNFGAVPPRATKPFIDNWSSQISTGQLKDPLGANLAADTNVPEFVDRFPNSLPILYLRARAGAPGTINTATSGPLLYQYDARQITPYTTRDLNGKAQGLRNAGNYTEQLSSKAPNNLLPFFRSPTNPGPNNATGNPRCKDGFILISAGIDGIFGTSDDITSFGSIFD